MMRQLLWKDPFLEALARSAKFNLRLPALTFFEPNYHFWDFIHQKDYAGIHFTDCGCGMGTVTEQGKKRGLEIDAVDISWRDGQPDFIRQMDATQLDWSPTHWPLICRPSHDGWHIPVLKNAQAQGATTVYVGLPSNYRKDLAGFGARRLNTPAVGDGGEQIYIITPKE